MRPLAECRVALASETLRQALVAHSRPGRRTGAIMLTEADGRLSGIFTDSDLARLLEANRDSEIDGPMADIMTRTPATIGKGSPLTEACEILTRRKISELPVVDDDGRPVGLIDITDVVGIQPEPVQGSKLKVQGRPNFRLLTPDS